MGKEDSNKMIYPIIATAKSLANEKLECTNMISLLEMASKEFDDPSMDVIQGSLIAVLAKYWQMRLSVLPALISLMKDLEYKDEDTERFIRHNDFNGE